jgi:signal transduction histidine kinase
MDLKNLISRIELAASLVAPQTIAKWQRLGLMPQPKECLSDRLILYDREEVRQEAMKSIVERTKGRRIRHPTRSCVDMRLSDFILSNMETIVAEWEAFAATRLPAAARMTPLALRDHARQILEAVAADLTTLQTKEDQTAKSMGRARKPIDAPETAAETHAILRARSGFDINQLAAEYRALRASVLRLWLDERAPDAAQIQDIIRFSEAIDQALAESISFFNAQVEQSRDLLLGMLGHDMRSPLQIILLTARHLAALNRDEEVSEAASLLIKSGARMKALLDDLVDFNRVKLGVGIEIDPSDVDLATLFADQLQQLRAANPDRQLELKVEGDTRGSFDAVRMQRLLDNLVVNAIKYGAKEAPIRVLLAGDGTAVRLEVTNAGPAIERSVLEKIFDPLTRGPERENASSADGSLGLGLYITREITKSHGGDIEARSDNTETVFTVKLPRARKNL